MEYSEGKGKTGNDLYDCIRDDLNNIRDWRDKQERYVRHRLGERKRSVLYPGAPNFVEPIIDNNIRDSVAQSLGVMFSNRQLASFIPMSSESAQVKRQAEMGFDTLLRMMIEFKRKMEHAQDNKFERGFAVVKVVGNYDAYKRYMGVDAPIPDIEVVDPFNVLVPNGTRHLQEAERVCQMHRYSVRQFEKLAEDRGWENHKEVLRLAKEKSSAQQESGYDNSVGYTPHISLDESEDSVDYVPVWEVYHYQGQNKYRTLFSPSAPKLILEQRAWVWLDDNSERPWPFVQFRNENRRLEFYDSRGLCELLIDNQKIANAMQNAKGIQLDFYTKPMLKGGRGKAQNIKWIPGESLPDGVEPVTMPRVDQIFDYSTSNEYTKAQRRSGSAQGGFSDSRSGGDKTATQVNAEQMARQRLTNVSVTRDSEPLSQLYTMMWEYLQHNPVALPIVSESGEFQDALSQVVYMLPFRVLAAGSNQNINPDFVLQQLMTLGPMLMQIPFVRQEKLAAIMVDQLNPQLTNELVHDPEKPEQAPAPLMMQMQQFQESGQQMAQEVQGNSAQIDNLTHYVGQQAMSELDQGEAPDA